MSIVRSLGAILVVVAVVGCDGTIVVHHTYAPPPAVVVEGPAQPAVIVEETYTPPPTVVEEVVEVQAPSAPPVLRVEMQPAAPTPDAVWIAGYWQWTKHGWRWVNGHYCCEHPVGQIYVAGAWGLQGGVYVWTPGRWVVGAAPAARTTVVEAPIAPGLSVVFEETELVQATTAPPPPVIEVRPACPVVGAVWIEGHYVHKKGHHWQWSKGYWFTGKHTGTTYVVGHWQPQGGVYIWVAGGWR